MIRRLTCLLIGHDPIRTIDRADLRTGGAYTILDSHVDCRRCGSRRPGTPAIHPVLRKGARW